MGGSLFHTTEITNWVCNPVFPSLPQHFHTWESDNTSQIYPLCIHRINIETGHTIRRCYIGPWLVHQQLLPYWFWNPHGNAQKILKENYFVAVQFKLNKNVRKKLDSRLGLISRDHHASELCLLPGNNRTHDGTCSICR